MRVLILAALAVTLTAPVAAQSASRDLLTQASFIDRDRATALRKVQAAVAATDSDGSYEARLICATAIAYRGKLTGSRSDASSAKQLYEAATKADPRNAEAQLGLGAWHLAVVNRAGALMGRVIGASRSAGNAALDRAVALGGNRAFYPGLAALFRLKANPSDQRGRQLAEQATRAATPTTLDRILQRAANAILVPVRAGNKAQTRATAHRLLPFGSFTGDD